MDCSLTHGLGLPVCREDIACTEEPALAALHFTRKQRTGYGAVYQVEHVAILNTCNNFLDYTNVLYFIHRVIIEILFYRLKIIHSVAYD